MHNSCQAFPTDIFVRECNYFMFEFCKDHAFTYQQFRRGN